MSDHVLEMKSYMDQLHQLSYVYPKNVCENLINRSLNKDFNGFVWNYNLHFEGKTVTKLLAMLVDYEKGLPKKAPTPQVLAIQGGRIQKPKSQANKKGKGKVDKGKQVIVYQLNPKKKNNPKRTR